MTVAVEEALGHRDTEAAAVAEGPTLPVLPTVEEVDNDAVPAVVAVPRVEALPVPGAGVPDRPPLPLCDTAAVDETEPPPAEADAPPDLLADGDRDPLTVALLDAMGEAEAKVTARTRLFPASATRAVVREGESATPRGE